MVPYAPGVRSAAFAILALLSGRTKKTCVEVAHGMASLTMLMLFDGFFDIFNQ